MKDSHLTHARTAVFNVNYHFVWCVKYRKKVLIGEIETKLKGLLLKIAVDNDFLIRNMEIMPDHVHVFASAHPKYAPGHLYKILKGTTARILFSEFKELKEKLYKGHLWAPTTYVETIGHISEATVVKYIEEQKTK